jgi:hypothetical protein
MGRIVMISAFKLFNRRFFSKPKQVKLLLSTILEDVWGNGGIAQLSRNDETGWK